MFIKKILWGSLVLFAACQQSNTNPQITNTMHTDSVKIDSNSTPITTNSKLDKPQTIKSLVGFWLSDAYLLKLAQSKSPFKEKDDKTFVWGFTLDSSELNSPQPMLRGFGMHEGGFDAVLLWNDQVGAFEYNASKDDIGFFKGHPFQIKSLTANSLELIYTKENKKETYRKVLDDHTAVNDAVLTGKYLNEADKKPLEFTTKGDLVGFPKGKKRYSIQYDFYTADQFDVLMVYDNTDGKGEVFYHYKWEGNKLLLYSVTGEMPEFRIGKLAYTFVKQ